MKVLTQPLQGDRAVTDETASRALRRIVAEISDGLQHGHFSFAVTCEVIGGNRRRLVLHAGKSYQFVIPADAVQAPTAGTEHQNARHESPTLREG